MIKAQIFFLFVGANYFLSKRTLADIYNQLPVSENITCHFLGITWLLADVTIVINREPGIGKIVCFVYQWFSFTLFIEI